jgi:uncharacterized protein YbaR (Trm112 family)
MGTQHSLATNADQFYGHTISRVAFQKDDEQTLVFLCLFTDKEKRGKMFHRSLSQKQRKQQFPILETMPNLFEVLVNKYFWNVEMYQKSAMIKWTYILNQTDGLKCEICVPLFPFANQDNEVEQLRCENRMLQLELYYAGHYGAYRNHQTEDEKRQARSLFWSKVAPPDACDSE